MPYRTGLSARSGSPIVYDSGDYPKTMSPRRSSADRLMPGFRERQRQARAAGPLPRHRHGHGPERAPAEAPLNRRPSAWIVRAGSRCYTGAVAIGQGPAHCARPNLLPSNFTSHPRISRWWRAIPVPSRWGSALSPADRPSWRARPCMSPRSRSREKTLKVAAEMLEVAVDDLELRDGRVEVKGMAELGLHLSRSELTMAGVPGYKLPGDCRPGLEHSHNFLNTSLTYSGASLAVELEVDLNTGDVTAHKIRRSQRQRPDHQSADGPRPGDRQRCPPPSAHLVRTDGLRRSGATG